MKKFIHTPEGVRDTYGKECARKRVLERQIESLFHTYGYQHIETPSFEFFDVFGKEVGTVSSRSFLTGMEIPWPCGRILRLPLPGRHPCISPRKPCPYGSVIRAVCL